MKVIIPLLFVFSSYLSLQANHIIGGTIEYTINSVVDDMVDMDVTFHVYRDAISGGAPFDQDIRIGLYGTPNNTTPNFNIIQVEFSTVEGVDEVDFSELLDCVPFGVSIQSAIYKANFTFLLDNYEDFVIAYQRCCRSGTVSNILEGEETGIALSLEITRVGMERIGNVKSFPNVFPVTNLPSEESAFDFSINDGLVKRYSLSHAKTAGGTDGVIEGEANSCTGILPDPILCPPPFVGPTYSLGSGEYGLYDEVTIDSFSGEFVSRLSSQGSYLIAVEAESYENGILLSKVYQQFLQVVSMCDPSSIIDQGVPDVSQDIYPVPARNLIYINNPLTDVSIIDATGVKQLEQSMINQEQGIDIGDFARGVYFLIGFNESGKKVTKRFVK